MGEEVIVLVCTTTAWTTLYFLLKSMIKKEPEFVCRLVTAIHACVATSLGIWHCFLAQPWSERQPGGNNTSMEIFTISNSLGYFIFDIIWCLYYQTEGYTMIIHHLVSLTALSRVLMKGVSATEAISGIGGLEITNPLLQLRWFLRDAGMKNTLLYKIVEVCFMTLFFVMRVIGGAFLTYSVVSHPRPDLEIKLLASAFYILSLVFMTFIFQYFAAKYFNFKKAKKEA